MKLLRYSAGICLVLIMFTPLNAQKRDLVARADAVFSIGEYFNAIEKYNKAYQKEKDKLRRTEITYKIAHCYRLINNNRKAESYYARVVRRKYPDPLLYYYYAEVLKINGKFEEAKEAYEEYLKSKPEDELARLAYQMVDSVQTWIDNPTRYIVENMEDFNSRDDDYSPFYSDDDYRELYFTSSRDGAEGNKVHGATGESFADLFFTRLDNKQKWSVPAPLDNKVNSEFDDGVPWVSNTGNTLYFTRCRFDKTEELGCQILMTKKSGDSWGEPSVLPVAHDSVVVAHASFTQDELTMFFASDMIGGWGGKDIYKVSREGTSSPWGPPENLGPEVNTTKDEMFPFLRSDSVIYFSSDGLPGLGGLDLFKAMLTETGKWEVENMKYPINSIGDDFGIVFQPEDEKGYFTSNRKDGRGGDDIYSFVLPIKRFSFRGLVINEKTEALVDSAEVRLIGSDGTSLEYQTDTTGEFSFRMNPETDYIIVAFKEGFLNGKLRETTMGQEESREFNGTLVLAPIEKPIELPNILYDLAKWDLRPESLVALDGLVETLDDNPNITIELMSHTDIRPFTTMTNLELSQRRAQSVVDYLIGKDIDPDRLKARGYGPEQPRIVDEKVAEQYDFLILNDTLSGSYIEDLQDEQIEEIAHQLNRRTEFRVLSTDFVPKEHGEGQFDPEQELINKGLEELSREAMIKAREERTKKIKEGIKEGK